MSRVYAYALAGLLAGPLAANPAAAAMPAPGSTAALLVERLQAALEARGVAGGERRIELDNAMLSLPKGMTIDGIRLENLSVDPKTGRLTAVLAAAEGNERLRLTGRVYQMAEVAVPARAIEPGEVIAERDLERATVRLDGNAQDPIADTSALVGKTPRHSLRAHEPVRPADLQSPLVIRRGDLVTMSVETPLMSLSAQGQAMEDAARGAPVRITNTKSNRVVEAVATGPGTASVDASAGH